MTGEDVAACARTWREVPIFHMGRTRAGGVDCLGLVICVGRELGLVGQDAEAPGYYGRLPNPKRLVEGLDRFMDRTASAAIGDVIALSWGANKLPMHLAILAQVAGRATIIHANPRLNRPRVVEMGYAGDWPRRACGSWRFRGVGQ